MKDKDYRYLVYRAYSEKERPGIPEYSRNVLYGWSSSKAAIKAFIEQRNPKKYKIRKATYDEIIANMKSDLDPEMMIDFVNLESASSGEVIKLFMTHKELREVEKEVQRYVNDHASLSDYGDPMTLLELYANLEDRYIGALQFIGFKPPEMDILFDSVEYRESGDYMYSIDGLIDSAYDQIYDVSHETLYHQGNIPGLNVLESVNQQILYSVESFMKVMKEDM